MNLNCDELQQWTALSVLGVLEAPESAVLKERFRSDPAAREELERFLRVALALVAAETPVTSRPSAGLRSKVMAAIAGRPQLPRPSSASMREPLPPGFRVMGPEAPWMESMIPGGRMKVLSSSPGQSYAMLLIELAAGAVYPEHDHLGTEEMYVLSGDLQSEGRTLGPGSFLHAEPGTHHRELRSVGGCTAILIIPRAALVGATPDSSHQAG